MFWEIDDPTILARFTLKQIIRKKEPKDVCHFDIICIDSKTGKGEINQIAAGLLEDSQVDNPSLNHFKICENGNNRNLDLEDLLQ